MRYILIVLLLGACAAPQPKIVEHADRPEPQKIPVLVPCISTAEMPQVPSTSVTKQTLERAQAAVKELANPPKEMTVQQVNRDLTDVLELTYALLVDLTRLEQYSVEADARLTGCLTDAKGKS